MKMNKNRKYFIYAIIFVLLIFSSFLFGDRFGNILLENKETLQGTSLLLAALIIGLVDGFNPCAMWVLIYLITLVAELKDRKKMWLVVGTFLFASGVIYFIILSMYLFGWELAIYLGYTGIVIKLAAVFALASGAYFLYDYFKSKGKVECKVSDYGKRKRTMDKIKEIVHSPFTIPTFIGLVLLAFSVNLAEFFCSIGLPQAFTNLLSITDITRIEQFFYIFIYIVAFMADDLLIFYFGLKAIESPLLTTYAGYAKLIGGIIMLLLGFILLFFPNMLL